MINLLAAGRAPRELSEHLCGASLIALAKDDNDVRPIAVGEVFRRLTSKCLCASVRDNARDFFEPLQVGVACPLGLEAAIHTVAQYVNRHAASANKLVLTIDFKNAFNSIDRNAFLRAACEHMQPVAAWACWCYSLPSRLLYDGHVIASRTGVQQGDNLGPLLFSLAFHPTLRALKAVQGIDVVVGYLDDVVIAGEAGSVLAPLGALQAALPGLGLLLNSRKCELIPTAGVRSAVDWSQFPPEMKRVADASFKFLGTPICSQEFVVNFTQQKRTDKAIRLLQEVEWLEDGQVAHKLLTRCMGACRVMHAMRTTRPDWITTQLRAVDTAVLNALEACMGLALPAAARQQASLPMSLGGCGLRSSERHAAAAYVSSRFATAELCQKMDANFRLEAEVPESGLALAVRLCNEALPEPQRLSLELLAGGARSQKEVSTMSWTVWFSRPCWKPLMLHPGRGCGPSLLRMQEPGWPLCRRQA